jgi:hypothetical protein
LKGFYNNSLKIPKGQLEAVNKLSIEKYDGHKKKNKGGKQ